MLAGSNLSLLEGRQGWLFLERYEDAQPLQSGADLTDWSRTMLPPLHSIIRTRHERLAARGIGFVVVVAPEKASIHGELLPAGVVQDLPTAAERLTAALRADGIGAVDAVTLLRGAKGAVPLYYDVDTHWTTFAAYRVYRALIAAAPAHMGLRPLGPETTWYRDKSTFGDLGVHMRPERKGTMQQPEIVGHDIESVIETFDDRECAFQRHVCRTGRGRALVVRDSFTTFLAPFLSRTFAETTYVAPSNALPVDLVEDIAPDLVILQVAERALFYPPDALVDWSIRGWRQIYLESEGLHPGRKYNRKTRQALKEGQWAEALLAAEAANALDPEGHFLHNLAEARLRTGDSAGALALCEGADRPPDRLLLTLAAYALWALLRPDEAILRLGQALALQPANARLHFQLGEWLMERGRPSEARPHLQAAVEVAPTHAPAWYHLGMAHHGLGEFPAAEDCFRRGGLI
ncbi:alginate O-acetyltransferase AlgX-related protein [Methylobacterium sp. J-068]|uniref:alginate O-acetyltransferase AlgX-related protein n=1 Tax=Methylobacterium sp. J-068 TaxID=2836649 RepID=UPI001FBBF90A|nr:tetratricopeptide repeat protein [Methylobacterium sp. J-068]MCJ2035233.1 tetratricopeptide repeat protein [Methylobacterium sp. J-068]